ncbi:MAG: B12-binding domain-containing radical SAM protein, partial [Bacteroidales bacterium]|nr:B12-binding domain-containing radical SAM protein [Bacteroidales bacterium]
MIQRFQNIQLVYCPHNMGKLSYEGNIQIQPPLGILTVATYLKNKNQEVQIEVIDGKLLTLEQIVSRIDAELVGLTVEYSNYKNTLWVIKKIKKLNPNITIILGGAYTSFMYEKILNNNPEIDYIIRGEGEESFSDFTQGLPFENIYGLCYRKNNKLIFNPEKKETNGLDNIPYPDLSLLYPKYSWKSSPESHSMSAFPFAGVRGCNRKIRCEYCSLSLANYRTVSPEKYWNDINALYRDYGINYFFETGDILSPHYIKKLADYNDHEKVAFRIYSYPGNFKDEHIPYLKSIGVKTIFMGIESVVVWKEKLHRKYKNGYSKTSLLDEINMLNENGMKVIPSFILGLTNENKETLNENVDLILSIASLKGVDELTVSLLLTLPGSHYFNLCLNNLTITNKYYSITKQDLTFVDEID